MNDMFHRFARFFRFGQLGEFQFRPAPLMMRLVFLMALFTGFWVIPMGGGPLAAQDGGSVPSGGVGPSGGAGIGADLFPNLNLGRYGQNPLGDNPLGTDAVDPDAAGEPASLEATYQSVDAESGLIVLKVKVTLQSPWHLYSMTQPRGGPTPTVLSLISPTGIDLVGPWRADQTPKKSVSPEFGGITIEEHEGEVTFSAPAQIRVPEQPVESLGKIQIRLTGLTCVSGGGCVPVDETLTAVYTGETPADEIVPIRESVVADFPVKQTPAKVIEETVVSELFRDKDYAVQWRAELVPSRPRPGQQIALRLKAMPDSAYHVYPAAIDDSPMSTNFVVEEKSGLRIGGPLTDAKVIRQEPIPGVINQYHEGEVTWLLPVQIPADAEPGEKTISGLIAYQACTDESCLMPMALEFKVNLNVVAKSAGTEAAGSPSESSITLTSVKSKDALTRAGSTDWVDVITPVAEDRTPRIASNGAATGDDTAKAGPQSLAAVSDSNEAEAGSFLLTLSLAFVGGIILNFMPCVLPVVGLKVMSFVQQAGENSRRVLWLNLVYTAGILAVFAVLAGLAVAVSFSWGEQFTYFPVRLTLTLLLFALALSYLGVWEIPVPGMAAGKTSANLQNQEGYTGAFFKGVFATILATPCSGPLLGYILGLTLGLTSVQTIAVIMTVGLGMAIPYVIIGMRPSLVSFLPKPGPWMETLKQFLAFLFLGTVAFFFAGFNDDDRVPVFVSLIGVWFGCWIIGLVPSWQSIQRRLFAWSGGIVAAGVIGIAAFNYLTPGEKVLAWEPYNEARLQQLQSEGKTVLVDFSAKWCVNCIVNLNVAIDTKPTAKLVDELDAVAMYADWTDRNDEIKAKLEELKSRSIPLLAIYPGENPQSPIILRDLVSQQTVLDALRQAGPSLTPGKVTRSEQRTPAQVAAFR